MGERKVLNKYYPPDFDPAKIPRRKMPKDRQYKVRLMAPFNMRCTTCGEYIYKGKKFNAMKETVQGEEYLGLRIFRFYIRCTRCCGEITFKTDPKNTDYACELGATRNFEAWKIADRLRTDEDLIDEEEEEENPMQILEKRTKESKQEMDILDALEEIRDANARSFNVNIDDIIQRKVHDQVADQIALKKKQDEEDENVVQSVFGSGPVVKRLESDDDNGGTEDENDTVTDKPIGEENETAEKAEAPTAILTADTEPKKKAAGKQKPAAWERSIGLSKKRKKASDLIVRKGASSAANKKQKPTVVTPKSTTAAPVSLVGNYSSSDSDD